jgi:hypothetical protein
MRIERYAGIVEELAEVASLNELKALWCFGQVENNEYADAECVPMIKCAIERLKGQTPVQGVEEEVIVSANDLELKLAALQAQLEALKQPTVKVSTMRGGKRYKLLSLDVSWSTKPQVHAIAAILAAHAKPGDVLDEADIVSMMVANEVVLETRQGGKRIWDYYKGNHVEGLAAHSNVEKV